MFAPFHAQPFTCESIALQRRATALTRSLTALAVAHFRHPLRTSSGIVERQAGELGLDDRDFGLVHVNIGKKAVVLAAITTRLWHSQETMALFHDLKSLCSVLGEHIVLVPEGFVMRQPRLDNAMLMADAQATIMPVGDRMRVLSHLIETGSATLSELASGLKHPDPITAILSMVTSGLLDMDLNRPILPTTLVSMAQPG